jgi:hypothetical protein
MGTELPGLDVITIDTSAGVDYTVRDVIHQMLTQVIRP